MSDSLRRDHEPEKALAIEQLRHHGIVVSDMAVATLDGDESIEYPASATQMLEWLRKSPGWLTTKR